MLVWLFPFERALLWLYLGILAILLLRSVYQCLRRRARVPSVPKGLQKKQLNTFPVFAFRSSIHGGGGDGGLDQCAICRDDYADGVLVRLLPCCHRFHAECIDAWVRESTSCPYCRRELAASVDSHCS